MPDLLADTAAWIALGCAVAALIIVAIAGWRSWRAWKRVRVVGRAASALVDVHMSRLDDALTLAGEQAGRLADDGERLADALADMKSEFARLRWLLEQIPDERGRLRRAIGDLLLPTSDERARTGPHGE